MASKLLIESDPHRTRVALLEEDRLMEIFLERTRQRSLVGNVYKGRVNRVLPGMQAAFVDLGLERDAFLYVGDVGTDPMALEDLELGDPEIEPLQVPEATPSIDDLLKPGQELIVQVVKEPLPNKGARISSQVTLPGRYLVLLPTVRHFGISRRIEEEEERTRLLALMEEIAPPWGGLIVRTVGAGRERQEFQQDLAYLTSLWGKIRDRAARAAAPTLLHQELDLARRVVRDIFNADFSVLWVDGEETYERIVEFLGEIQPALLPRVQLHRQEGSLFAHFGIEEEIDRSLESKVWLKSGGYLVIHPTEALVAIDVNTGRFVGERTLEETVLRTNLEAVKEVVRQIRLRDLGGIIVVDLIDMIESSHREEVFAVLERELKKDRARNKVLNISEFGLVEITRKRSRANLERLLTQPCPYCHGRGRIRSMSTICLTLRRELLRLRHRLGSAGEVLIRVHPDVSRALQQEEREILEEMERTLGVNILIQSDSALHHERFDILEV